MVNEQPLYITNNPPPHKTEQENHNLSVCEENLQLVKTRWQRYRLQALQSWDSLFQPSAICGQMQCLFALF